MSEYEMSLLVGLIASVEVMMQFAVLLLSLLLDPAGLYMLQILIMLLLSIFA